MIVKAADRLSGKVQAGAAPLFSNSTSSFACILIVTRHGGACYACVVMCQCSDGAATVKTIRILSQAPSTKSNQAKLSITTSHVISFLCFLGNQISKAKGGEASRLCCIAYSAVDRNAWMDVVGHDDFR